MPQAPSPSAALPEARPNPDAGAKPRSLLSGEHFGARGMVVATYERNLMVLWALLAVVYLAFFFWLGLATLRNGHAWLFFFGIFFPILWIFGAFARPADPAAQA